MLRNFQLHYTPQAFHAESAAWAAIIHLNLVRSVNFILSLLQEREKENKDLGGGSSSGSSYLHGVMGQTDGRPVTAGGPQPGTPRSSTSSKTEGAGANTVEGGQSTEGASVRTGSAHSGSGSSATSGSNAPHSAKSIDELRRIRMRLSPLRTVEEVFLKFVTGTADSSTMASAAGASASAAVASASMHGHGTTSLGDDGATGTTDLGGSDFSYPPQPSSNNGLSLSVVDTSVGSTTSWQRKKGYERTFEVSVRSGSKWKSLFKPLTSGAGQAGGKGKAGAYDELKNARAVLSACKEDIVALWEHPVVRTALAKESMMLQFQSGL